VLKVVVKWVMPTGIFPLMMKTNYYDWTALLRMML
jgi:hypothetical protein